MHGVPFSVIWRPFVVTLTFNQPDFVMANKILNGLLKQKRRSGDEAVVIHEHLISHDDWQRIMDFFIDVATTNDPRLMTFFVWFLMTRKTNSKKELL